MPQLSYVHGASGTPFIGDTIGAHFDRIAEAFGERDALVVRHQEVRWTYRELKERVDAFAEGLLALGLRRGDRIGANLTAGASGAGKSTALRSMIDLLGREHGMPAIDAYLLSSVCGDLRISEVVDVPNWTVSFYVPRAVFD